MSGEPPLGIRYTILKVNPDNSTSEVSSDTVFHSGDRIRFAIEPNGSGYLYIVNQGSSGTWKPGSVFERDAKACRVVFGRTIR